MPTTPFTVHFENAVIAGETAGFGLPVVFLHAEMADRRMWTAQLEMISQAGYHVIAYDRRGFGETESADEPFSHVVDLEAVLDQLGLGGAVLVGASAGGALAIDFALENPDRTLGLVLVGTDITGAEEPEWPETALDLIDARDYAARRGGWSTANRIDAHLWLDGVESPEGRVEGEARDLLLVMNGAKLERETLTGEEPAESAIGALGQIAAPTLLVVGQLDLRHVIERHEMLAEEIPDAFAMVLEGTAHLPSLERPDIFDPLLLEFLDAVSGAALAEHGDDGGDD